MIQFKHSFQDPILNPPKKKGKTNRTIKAAPIQKDNNVLSNNVLSRIGKTSKVAQISDQKLAA